MYLRRVEISTRRFAFPIRRIEISLRRFVSSISRLENSLHRLTSPIRRLEMTIRRFVFSNPLGEREMCWILTLGLRPWRRRRNFAAKSQRISNWDAGHPNTITSGYTQSRDKNHPVKGRCAFSTRTHGQNRQKIDGARQPAPPNSLSSLSKPRQFHRQADLSYSTPPQLQIQGENDLTVPYSQPSKQAARAHTAVRHYRNTRRMAWPHVPAHQGS